MALTARLARNTAQPAAKDRRGQPDPIAIAAVNGLGVAIPGFVAAEVLIAVFAVRLGWFPVLGSGQGLGGRLQHLTLPAAARGFDVRALLLGADRGTRHL